MVLEGDDPRWELEQFGIISSLEKEVIQRIIELKNLAGKRQEFEQIPSGEDPGGWVGWSFPDGSILTLEYGYSDLTGEARQYASLDELNEAASRSPV